MERGACPSLPTARTRFAVDGTLAVDSVAAAAETSAMRWLSTALLAVCTALLPGQVALPHGTGTVRPDATWTVLKHDELLMESRPTDPTEEPARSILLEVTAALRSRQRTTEHVFLHQLGARPNQLRGINAYSTSLRIAGTSLRDDVEIERMRGIFEDALRGPENEVAFVGHRHPDLFATTAVLALTYRVTARGSSWSVTYYFVPCGERLQYFEALHFPNDPEALPAIEAVLRTFDGAKDPGANNILWLMTIGGLTGGIAGALAALLRRRLRRPAAPAA